MVSFTFVQEIQNVELIVFLQQIRNKLGDIVHEFTNNSNKFHMGKSLTNKRDEHTYRMDIFFGKYLDIFFNKLLLNGHELIVQTSTQRDVKKTLAMQADAKVYCLKRHFRSVPLALTHDHCLQAANAYQEYAEGVNWCGRCHGCPRL